MGSKYLNQKQQAQKRNRGAVRGVLVPEKTGEGRFRQRMCASEASASGVLVEASSSGLVSMSTRFFPMEWNMTSRDSWVMPRCDRGPRTARNYEEGETVSGTVRSRQDS